MSRVKSGKVTHARHRKVIKAAKGYYAARSTNFRSPIPTSWRRRSSGVSRARGAATSVL